MSYRRELFSSTAGTESTQWKTQACVCVHHSCNDHLMERSSLITISGTMLWKDLTVIVFGPKSVHLTKCIVLDWNNIISAIGYFVVISGMYWRSGRECSPSSNLSLLRWCRDVLGCCLSPSALLSSSAASWCLARLTVTRRSLIHPTTRRTPTCWSSRRWAKLLRWSSLWFVFPCSFCTVFWVFEQSHQ